MNKILVLLLLTLYSSNLYAQSEEMLKKADSLAIEGVKLANDNKFEEAIKMYDLALAIDSNSIQYIYEIALSYYKLQNFDTVITLLNPLRYRDDIFPKLYQILGNSYDITMGFDSAFEVYAEGLIKFPEEGALYQELGISQLGNEDHKGAMMNWELGVKAAPKYANNYFLLSKYMFFTDEFIWVIMYGEIFMNISENARQLEDISIFLNNSFKNAFFKQRDSTTIIKFTKFNIISKNLKQREGLPFELAYQIIMREAAEGLLPDSVQDLKILDIYKIRKRFIEIWYKENWNKKFSNALFDLHKKLIKGKLFEAYHYWLFNAPRKEESEAWLKINQEKLQDFGNFMVKNQLKLHKANYIQRNKYHQVNR